MPKATSDHNTSRRMVMAGGASLAALTMAAKAVAAPGPAGPDAELIRLSEDYMRAIRAFNAYEHILPGMDRAAEEEATDKAWAEIVPLEHHLDATIARTMEGVVAEAKVTMCLAWAPEEHEFGDAPVIEWSERVVRSLLRVQGEAA